MLRGAMCHGRQDAVVPLVRFVFEELVAARLLPILQSLREITSGGDDNGRYSEMPGVFLNDVLDAMRGTDLFEEDEWMLKAAPLRAVARRWGDGS